MKPSRFAENQILTILKEVELGVTIVETCRQHGISDKTYYKWKHAMREWMQVSFYMP